MKSFAMLPAARALSFDLEKADLAASGFWWCRHCRRVTEPAENDQGLSGQRCAHCQSLRIEWKAPVAGPGAGPVKGPRALPAVRWELEAQDPSEGKPRQHVHRLPEAKRDLRRLARSGYFFCFGCREITERAEDSEACVLCGSAEVRWQEPVFGQADDEVAA